MPTDQCPACASTDLLVVSLSPNGRDMRFLTCRHCERRWWEDLDSHGQVDLPAVLAQIATG